MNLRNLTFNQIEQLQTTEAAESLQMDQETFRQIYDRTSRQLWVFLWRRTRDAQATDDLLQETYYRLLRVRNTFESDAHLRNYLFRIATNLANDSYRQRK